MAAEFGEQYAGMQGQMRRGDNEHGNPIDHQNITEGMHGHGGAHGTTPTALEGMQQHQQQQQQQPQHRRSGSSSSSSEDDGEGGRRKKGMKGKMMKEKMGEGHEGEHQAAAAHMTCGNNEGEEVGEGGEKKGMMEKIKEKIPGMH